MPPWAYKWMGTFLLLLTCFTVYQLTLNDSSQKKKPKHFNLPRTTLLSVLNTIPANTAIELSNIRPLRWKVDEVPKNAITHSQDLLGAYALRTLEPGKPILKSDLFKIPEHFPETNSIILEIPTREKPSL